MSELGSYGFTFREDGSMPGYGGIIENLKRTLDEEEFDEVFGKVEDYLETTYQTIPQLQTEFEELNVDIEEMEAGKIDVYSIEHKLNRNEHHEHVFAGDKSVYAGKEHY